MTSPSQNSKQTEARKKGTVAAAATAGSVVLLAVPGVNLAVGAVGLGVSAVLGYRWLRYRIQNGLRF